MNERMQAARAYATDEGLEQALQTLRTLEGERNAAERALDEAQAVLETRRLRHPQVNQDLLDAATARRGAEASAFDEYLNSCPPVAEFAIPLEHIKDIERFLERALRHLVTGMIPDAVAALHDAQAELLTAQAKVADQNANINCIRRMLAIGPLLEVEGAIEIGGGQSQSLHEEAVRAWDKARKAHEQAVEYRSQLHQQRAQMALAR
jgi:hypothetical protein